jgi:hypothetical protein
MDGTGVAMFVGFPNHFTDEPAENAENSPYFLCEFSDLCGEGNVTSPFYPLPDGTRRPEPAKIV